MIYNDREYILAMEEWDIKWIDIMDMDTKIYIINRMMIAVVVVQTLINIFVKCFLRS